MTPADAAPRPPAALSKTLFHLALPGLFCPAVGVPLTWSFALFCLFQKSEDPAHRTWTRRLFTLAIVDTVIIGLLVASLAAGGALGQGTLGGPAGVFGQEAPRGRVIGVMLDPASEGQRRVQGLAPGMPAERAGVKAGDLIVEVNGQAVKDGDEARARISSTPEGQPVSLVVEREGQRVQLEVGHVDPAERERVRSLFEPEAPGECTPLRGAEIPWGLVVVGAAAIGLYVAGRRRQLGPSLMFAAALLLGVAVLTDLAAVATCRAAGGPSRGAVLVALAVQTSLLLVGGLVLLRFARKDPRDQPPRPGRFAWVTTALLGGLYMLGGAARIALLLTAISRLLPETGEVGAELSPFSNSPIHAVGGSGLGLWGALAFVLPVAILGPIAEEVLFRGVVLPYLRGLFSDRWAIAISAVLFGVLHLYYGPFVLVIVFYGVVLGWVRIRSGTLIAPIALHVAVNSLASAVLILRSL